MVAVEFRTFRQGRNSSFPLATLISKLTPRRRSSSCHVIVGVGVGILRKTNFELTLSLDFRKLTWPLSVIDWSGQVKSTKHQKVKPGILLLYHQLVCPNVKLSFNIPRYRWSSFPLTSATLTASGFHEMCANVEKNILRWHIKTFCFHRGKYLWNKSHFSVSF